MEEETKAMAEAAAETSEEIGGTDLGGGAEGPGEGAQGRPERKPQTREENARYAQMRREARERAEREEAIRKEAALAARKELADPKDVEALGIGEIEGEDDVFLLDAYRKAKAEGDENPEASAYRALHAKRREEGAKAKEEERERERSLASVAEEQRAFRAKYGKGTGDVLRDEPRFKALFDAVGSPGNFTKLYEAYLGLEGQERDEAKRQGSFPSSASGTPGGQGAAETDEEFRKRWKRTYQ